MHAGGKVIRKKFGLYCSHYAFSPKALATPITPKCSSRRLARSIRSGEDNEGLTSQEIEFAMMFDHPTYQLVLYDATSGKEIRRATVLDTHRLNVGDDIGGYRIIRVRPESTRDVGHVDVVQITEDD
jgi:hypothetical protein